uniref:Two pore segment channel 2 n=1 Tax=Tetraodon nigroviridis TaxID=99883 RepID=H3CCM3_TETNG
DDDHYIQQAVVFIEDAIQYRSINHRVDDRSLRLYRWYYSKLCQWCLGLTIAVVLLLAFVERPSSLSFSSDPRLRATHLNPVCGVTESVELLCLIIFCLDLAVKSYLIGWEEFKKNKWLISYMVVISVSFIDWMLSVSMVCDERLRVRRLIRPFFLLQNSSLMKKTLKCIKRTLPEIASVILLLALHLCLFTMIGMLLFAKTEDPEKNEEWSLHFRNLPMALTSLLVLLTTANNPDVMMPAYSLNRIYAVFFVLFSVIGTYCLMNLLTAIIYNQFRGYLLMSVQTSIIRRRLGIRAAFQVLTSHEDRQAVSPGNSHYFFAPVLQYLQNYFTFNHNIVNEIQQYADVGYMDREQFNKIFDELDKDRIKEHPPVPQYNSPVLQRLQEIFSHYYLTIFGNIVALANVLCIGTVLVLNAEKSIAEKDNVIMQVNTQHTLLIYQFMTLKLIYFQWLLLFLSKSNDGLLKSVMMYIVACVSLIYRDPTSNNVISLWDMVSFINMLIVFRFLRIIPNIKLMALVAGTLLDLVKNLRAFAGILVVVYYVYAVLGIWLFEGVIKPPPEMLLVTLLSNIECGTYEQLGYWPNNFDDFAAAIILLYDVMIVNNWQAFLDAYSRYTTGWSKIYFVCWWLTSSVMWVNLFIALILEVSFLHR